jgi:hypothetical protein
MGSTTVKTAIEEFNHREHIEHIESRMFGGKARPPKWESLFF